MEFLSSQQYQLLPLAEYTHQLRNEKKFSCRTAVLNFDDGYANFFQEAYPILKKYNFRATIFVSVNFIGKRYDILPHLNLLKLNWEEIRFLSEEGFEFGSHCMHHFNLTSLSIVQARFEIEKSKAVLEDALGKEVTSFCYPNGVFNREICDMVKECGYHSAVTLIPGNSNDVNNIYTLRRVVIGASVDLAYFRLTLGSLFKIYNRFFQLHQK